VIAFASTSRTTFMISLDGGYAVGFSLVGKEQITVTSPGYSTATLDLDAGQKPDPTCGGYDPERNLDLVVPLTKL
jgi:hypothetical protein